MMNFLNALVLFIPRAIMQGTPLLYGATGEIITEKSGHLNLGIPGIMYVGGICGGASAFIYEHSVEKMNTVLAILIPFLSCLIGSLIMGLIYCFLTVTLRSNQNVTGLALTTFGIGIGNFFGGTLAKLLDTGETSLSFPQTKILFKTALPFADKLGWFGKIFLSHGFLVYLAVVLAILCSWVLNRTRQSVQFFIFSEKYEEIAEAIMTQVPRGVTFLDAKGGYSKAPTKVVTTIARQHESATIFRLVNAIDPNAFVSQSQVRGVFGQGFESIREKA